MAEITGVRPIGGAVLVLLAAATLAAARPLSPARGGGWLAVVAVAFALSHVVADALTTWGAVAAAAAVVTAAAAALLSR